MGSSVPNGAADGYDSAGTLEPMSDATPATEREELVLDAEDRAWLEEQLRDYREMLVYLREH